MNDATPRARISDDQLHAIKDRNPVDAVAGAWVKLRIKRPGEYIGPCPICSRNPESKSAPRFECDANGWRCAVCSDGGDVIRLVMKRQGIDFMAAVEYLGGSREEVVTPKLARARGVRDHHAGLGDNANPYPSTEMDLCAAWRAGWADGERRAKYEVFARERERLRLRKFMLASTRIAGTPVQAYLAGRGLMVPPNARLKYHPAMPLFSSGREVEPTVAHTGPAMLAPFYSAEGVGIGLHITWLDPAGPKGKARVVDPDTGEILPAKKMRGTKAGGFIDLGGCDPAEANRLIAGEGIETVLAVYTALVRSGRDVSRTLFRAAGDLGNLAGRACDTLAHPTAKTKGGRPQRVPGPDPDLTGPAMPVPDVSELVLLGDGDSDPFLTGHAMERARRRHEAPGRLVRVRFAPRGIDFDDLLTRPGEADVRRGDQ